MNLHLHVYYPDLLNKILFYLRNGKFHRAVVTGEYKRKKRLIKDALGKCKIKWLDVPNRGHDVGPFFEAINAVTDGGIWFKVHVKRNVVWPVTGYSWRDELLTAILGTRDRFHGVCEALRNYEGDLAGAIVCATEHAAAEDVIVRRLMRRFRLKPPCGVYIAGTIVAMSDRMVDWLRNTHVRITDFESEHRIGGQMSHAWERMLGRVARIWDRPILGLDSRPMQYSCGVRAPNDSLDG